MLYPAPDNKEAPSMASSTMMTALSKETTCHVHAASAGSVVIGKCFSLGSFSFPKTAIYSISAEEEEAGPSSSVLTDNDDGSSSSSCSAPLHVESVSSSQHRSQRSHCDVVEAGDGSGGHRSGPLSKEEGCDKETRSPCGDSTSPSAATETTAAPTATESTAAATTKCLSLGSFAFPLTGVVESEETAESSETTTSAVDKPWLSLGRFAFPLAAVAESEDTVESEETTSAGNPWLSPCAKTSDKDTATTGRQDSCDSESLVCRVERDVKATAEIAIATTLVDGPSSTRVPLSLAQLRDRHWRSCCSEAVRYRCEAFGEDHPRTVMAWTELGRAQMDLSEYGEAQRSYVAALDALERRSRRELGRGRRRGSRRVAQQWPVARALALEGLGLAQSYRARGGRGSSSGIGRSEVETETWSPSCNDDEDDHEDDHDSRRSLLLLGALESLHEALRIRRDELGPRHADTVNALNHVAVTWMRAGCLETAHDCFWEVFCLRKMSFGNDHPSVAVAAHNLANCWLLRGKKLSARLYFQMAASIYDDMDLPSHNPAVALLLRDMQHL